MNNDPNLNIGNTEPEVLPETPPIGMKNLITVMVLSITLANEILGNKAPKNGKLEKGQGQHIIRAIEKAIKKTFPDMAPMILGMFGLEMMNLMPILKDPDKLITEMIMEYSGVINPYAGSNTQPNMG